MANPTPKNIVIIGGSVGGLFTAIPLLRLGHNITILERTPSTSLSDQGAGITVSPVANPILEKYLTLFPKGAPLIDFFTEYDRTKTPYHVPTGQSLVVWRSDGNVKITIPGGVYVPAAKHFPGGSSWDVLYNVLRANFDGGYEGGYISAAGKEEGDGEARYLDGVSLVELKDLGEKVEVVHSGGSIIADFVVGADGQSSTVGKLLDGEKRERKYAGYVAWRGTVKESECDVKFVQLLQDNMMAHFGKNTQVIMYLPLSFPLRCLKKNLLTRNRYPIPGKNGTVEKGEKLVNMVWYTNVEDPKDILTDSSGVQHKYSLGVGIIRPEIKEYARNLAKETLPPPLAELFNQIENPFIQAITDNFSTKASFMDGKVVLVGDALFGLRPHSSVGAQQAALHALLLKDVFEGKSTLEDWEKKVMEIGSFTQQVGVQMGTLSQFGDHPLADNGE
jgi:2-polyprenyl-6-methoxyphenol hydroxylase-like FAD-dependent oxidoreductase